MYKREILQIIFALIVAISSANVCAESDKDWRFSAGVHSGGRSLERDIRVSDVQGSSEFKQEAGGVAGAEFALARRLWGNWRAMAYYTLMTGEEFDAWNVTQDGEPAVVEVGSRSREQQLGVAIIRAFHWGERWAPYLGLGLGVSRFRSHMYVNLEPLSGTGERASEDIPVDSEWFYTGVAGMEYLFGQSWSTELELQHIDFPGGNRFSGKEFNVAMRVAYRF